MPHVLVALPRVVRYRGLPQFGGYALYVVRHATGLSRFTHCGLVPPQRLDAHTHTVLYFTQLPRLAFA